MTALDTKSAARRRRNGLIGAGFAAVCCFTPLPVVVLAGLGLSAWVGGLDYVLFPLLFGFTGLVAHALWLERGRPGRSPKAAIVITAVLATAALYALAFRYALALSLALALAVAAYEAWLRRAAPAPAQRG